MPKPISCLAEHEDGDTLCGVPVEWWHEDTHDGPHGWDRTPKQVRSRAEFRRRLQEKMPALAERLKYLEENPETRSDRKD